MFSKPRLFTEYPEPDERQYYDLLAAQAKLRMDNLYKDTPRALRDTHAKSHACVKASLEIFDINEDAIRQRFATETGLTDAQVGQLQIKRGLLAKPGHYPVWLRFANGRTQVEQDYVADTRSMTVKIIGVEGDRLPQSHEQHTQDIIVQNAEIFFIKTIRDYYGFFAAVVQSEKAAGQWLFRHPRQFLALMKITSPTPKSLLTERYWSGSAFALGLPPDFDPSQLGTIPVTYPAVVKYAFTPVTPDPPHDRLPFQSRPGIPKLPFSDRAKALDIPPGQPDNYYRNELVDALAQPDAHYCWDFGIQFQTHPGMSIDDATVVWQERESPFLTVGRLTVTQQAIDPERQFDFCENLRFSVWNGLAVHRPVGALNRLRSVVYPIVAEYRLQKQGIHHQEPTGHEQL